MLLIMKDGNLTSMSLEFPSIEKATEALESDEYKSIVAHRTDNSDTEYGSFMLLEGLE